MNEDPLQLLKELIDHWAQQIPTDLVENNPLERQRYIFRKTMSTLIGNATMRGIMTNFEKNLNEMDGEKFDAELRKFEAEYGVSVLKSLDEFNAMLDRAIAQQRNKRAEAADGGAEEFFGGKKTAAHQGKSGSEGGQKSEESVFDASPPSSYYRSSSFGGRIPRL